MFFFLFFFESSAHSVMSSGFEVRALTVDRNRLKRMRTNEDEEIFTIQVSNTMLSVWDKIWHCSDLWLPVENELSEMISQDSVSKNHFHVGNGDQKLLVGTESVESDTWQ